jgi:twinkle protein
MTAPTLGRYGIAAFEGRGISAETAARYGAYTGRKGSDGAVEPDENGNVVVFPFIEHGRTVAEKYRAPGKVFWQRKGGRRTFWNADVLDDPALEQGTAALVITEGEIDALTALDCGFPFAVSVPDGAPAVKEGDSPDALEPIDPQHEHTGKFEFLWNNRDRLKRIKRFILAVDNDPPGQRLAAELVRRLSASRCMFVAYPDGCKDLNDVLRLHGQTGVSDVLNGARQYPVRGLYRLQDYPDVAEPETFSTGWPELDPYLQLWAGELVVITGIPGHGKSTWALNLCVNLAKRHGWTLAVASFEIPTVPALRHKLRLAAIEAGKDRWTRDRVDEADGWINRHFVFIDDDPSGGLDEELTLEWLLDRAEDAVMRDGIRVLVIDPWNEVEHARPRHESETQYVNRALRQIRRFALKHDVIAIVIAHPTKDVGKEGRARTPTLYDIEGCYSDDTEVLTQRGWLHHGQLTLSDDVACFDPETGQVQYHQPERIIRREHSGEMYRFEGAGYDLSVTPDHRMLVKPKWVEPVGEGAGKGRPVRFPKGRWTFCDAQDIPGSPLSIPLAGEPIDGAEPQVVTIGSHSYPAEAFWRLVGWYVAEGHVGPTGLTWAQQEGALAEAFTETFASAGIPARVGWQQPRGKGKAVVGRWYIGNRHCRALVAWFRANCGEGAAGKRVPAALFELAPRLKRVFLDAYLEGDGSAAGDGFRAVTVSRRLRDDLQRLAVELGVPTNSSERDAGKANHQRQYEVRFGRPQRREVTMRTGRNLIVEKYSGLVWCLTVPTGAYFVRRNGRVAVSGNSAAWYNKPDHGIVIDVPDATTHETVVWIKKARFSWSGKKGDVTLEYMPEVEGYRGMGSTTPIWKLQSNAA